MVFINNNLVEYMYVHNFNPLQIFKIQAIGLYKLGSIKPFRYARLALGINLGGSRIHGKREREQPTEDA